MKLAGSPFLVTGGASGLGAACVRYLNKHGAPVVIADLRPPAEPPPEGVRFIVADVSQEDSMQQAVNFAVEAFDGLRGLVNCAGVECAERVLGRNGPHSLDTFLRTIHVNLIGTFNAIRLSASAMSAMAPMEEGERGVIVCTASISAFDGQIGQAAYSASKGGIVGMTLPLARELARYGIRVATIAPGVFDTPLMGRLSEAVQKSLAEQVPFPPRFGRPEEFAELVGHIAVNAMLNGETIRLDGALRMAGK